MHERGVQNNKLSRQIQQRKHAQRAHESKILREEQRAIELRKQLEKIENKENIMIENLRNTHMIHMNAYAQMQKVYDSCAKSSRKAAASPLNKSGISTANVSPYRFR